MKNIKSMKNQQSGFTLVEIAIVLVIIGLLLGGILKGQELINSAKVKAMVNDMKLVATQVYGYQDRFKAMPGMIRAQIPILRARPLLPRRQQRWRMDASKARGIRPPLRMNHSCSGSMFALQTSPRARRIRRQSTIVPSIAKMATSGSPVLRY